MSRKVEVRHLDDDPHYAHIPQFKSTPGVYERNGFVIAQFVREALRMDVYRDGIRRICAKSVSDETIKTTGRAHPDANFRILTQQDFVDWYSQTHEAFDFDQAMQLEDAETHDADILVFGAVGS